MMQTGYEMVRYADDFVILCDNQVEAQQALAMIQPWADETGLILCTLIKPISATAR
ncbi:MAG: hypothetical protein GQ529_12490 [Methyloprofundus sp.]|nr:hypothetical protein [Methyloprofundus sp.]